MRIIKNNTRIVFLVGFSLIFIIIPSIFISFMNINISHISNDNSNSEEFYNQTPKLSAVIGFINLTNHEVNNTEYTHNTTIPVKGNIYNIPSGLGASGLDVCINVNGINYYDYYDTTDGNGDFLIPFRIPYSLATNTNHIIKVNITTDLGGNTYLPENHYVIDVNTTSEISITPQTSNNLANPLLPGEIFTVAGQLKRADGPAIPSKQVFRYWKNEHFTWGNGSFFTEVNGGVSQNIVIPINTTENNITMIYNYTSVAGEYMNSQFFLFFKVFRNITCIWNIVDTIAEGQGITIQGRIISSEDPNMGISGRSVRVYYDGNQISTPITDQNGNFSISYQIPLGTGITQIQIGIMHPYYGGIILSDNAHSINITQSVEPPGISEVLEPPVPFENFLIILIPIIAVVGGALAVLGYYFLKKQEKQSQVVNLPLAEKIKNLKILKDSGRLEEAISYLFNAIYMDLINAKFGRTKKLFETIRDIAIVSVTELKLNPTTIYPFIQKVEEIIYARPFSITERDFYDACGLFSPIYFQLTGYNFILNF